MPQVPVPMAVFEIIARDTIFILLTLFKSGATVINKISSIFAVDII